MVACQLNSCLPVTCILSTCNQVIPDPEIQDLSDHRCHLLVQGLEDHRLVQGLQDHLSDQDLQDQDLDLDLEVHLQAPSLRKNGFHRQAGLPAAPVVKLSGNGCGL